MKNEEEKFCRFCGEKFTIERKAGWHRHIFCDDCKKHFDKQTLKTGLFYVRKVDIR